MKGHSLLGLIEESDIIGGGRGHGEEGGQCPELSGAVLTDRDTTVVLVTPLRPEQSG